MELGALPSLNHCQRLLLVLLLFPWKMKRRRKKAAAAATVMRLALTLPAPPRFSFSLSTGSGVGGGSRGKWLHRYPSDNYVKNIFMFPYCLVCRLIVDGGKTRKKIKKTCSQSFCSSSHVSCSIPPLRRKRDRKRERGRRRGRRPWRWRTGGRTLSSFYAGWRGGGGVRRVPFSFSLIKRMQIKLNEGGQGLFFLE